MPYRKAAREYLHVDDALLLGAIKRGELPAYLKPTNKQTELNYIVVNLGDVDEWVRTYWKPYTA